MADDVNSDISFNDENSYKHVDADAYYDSSGFDNRKRENGISFRGHGLIILQDHDGKEYNSDDADSTTTLKWTSKGENWLHIGAAPTHLSKNGFEKNTSAAAAASAAFSMTSLRKSAIEDTHTDEPKGLTPKRPDNTTQEKAASFQIMQTQESSSPPTQQTQTDVQESQTQETMNMSLLAYLNQPSQEETTTAMLPADVLPKIEFLTRDNLISLLSSSTQYPPNDSAFLCFEELSTHGSTQNSYMTVKDMRNPSRPCKNTGQGDVKRDVVAKIDLLSADRDVSVGWNELPRRKLVVLCPGDRIRITIAPARGEEKSRFENRAFANITIVLEYRYTKDSRIYQLQHRLPTPTMGKKSVSAEEIESTIRHDTVFCDEKTKRETDEHLNTFCGTTNKAHQCRDGMPHRAIGANSRELQNSLNSTISGEFVLDGNASVAVDSTVNSQQEFLRPSRIELLARNCGICDNIEDGTEISKEKAVKTCDPIDKKNVQHTPKDEPVKLQEKSKHKEDCHSSDTTIPCHNTQEIIDGDDEIKTKTADKADDCSSTATFAHCFTQETTDPFGDNKENGDDKSDDSSGATIHLDESQDPLNDLDKKNNEATKKENCPSKIKLGCDTLKEVIRNSHPRKSNANDLANVPRNIEIEDDQEDGDKAPVSQLLLSMETDNEENDDTKDDDHSDGIKQSTELTQDAIPSPQKLDSEKRRNESLSSESKQEDACEANDIEPGVQKVTNKENEECNPNIAVDLTDNSIEEECDDETILGTYTVVNKSKQKDTFEAKDIESGVRKLTDERKDERNPSAAVVFTDNEVQEERGDDIPLATDVIVEETINSSKTRGSVDDTLKCKNDDDKDGDESMSTNTQDLSEKRAQVTDDLDVEVTNLLCSIKNRAKETPFSVADSEKTKRSEIVLRSGRKRKTSTTPVEPKALTTHNRETSRALSRRPSRVKKQRRTLTFQDDLEAARDADKLYENRFRVAIENKVINILVSGFEEDVMNRISKFCTTKFSNVTCLRIIDTIDNNITACILPTVSNNNEEASCRTLKAIRCALLGIPMISLACFERWRKERKITIPTNFIRSLSSKVGRLTLRDCARYGVARLAAARCKEPQNPPLPFQNAFVFLCGSYPNEKKKSMIELLKEGCATIITSSREASATLKTVMHPSDKLMSPQKSFVLVFGNRGKPIPKFLQKEIMSALEDCHSRKIYVVDTNWLSLSIACSKMLPPDDFKPNDGVDLWERSKALPE